MTARKFHIVAPEPEPEERTPEQMLAELVPRLIALEDALSQVRSQIDLARRRLATKRGVSFIRPEHVRREFAKSEGS